MSDIFTDRSGKLRHVGCELAAMSMSQGDNEKVVQILQPWLPVLRVSLPPTDEHTIHMTALLATAFEKLGRYSEAIELRAELVRVKAQIHGQDNIAVMASYLRLGWNFYLSGHREAATHFGSIVLDCARLGLNRGGREALGFSQYALQAVELLCLYFVQVDQNYQEALQLHVEWFELTNPHLDTRDTWMNEHKIRILELIQLNLLKKYSAYAGGNIAAQQLVSH